MLMLNNANAKQCWCYTVLILSNAKCEELLVLSTANDKQYYSCMTWHVLGKRKEEEEEKEEKINTKI